MDITYYLEDGYAGSKSRPHHVSIDDEDLEDCESEAEKEDFIDQAVQDHFEQHISFYWERSQMKNK